MDIRVYYEDTDCGGVVYYANYLKYFERARTEYMELRGIFIPDCLKLGFFFVVAHQDIDYKSPAFYADILNVETRVSKVSSASFRQEYFFTCSSPFFIRPILNSEFFIINSIFPAISLGFFGSK